MTKLLRTVSTAEGFRLQSESLRACGSLRWTGRSLLRGCWGKWVLREHRGRDSSREHGEHGGCRGRAVAQHGGEDTRVTRKARGRLGQVLGQGSHSGPGDGGQLEQVLGEGGVVVGQGGEGHPG